MNRKNLISTLFVLLILSLASVAQAQATRTWVSGVGDDANPCSRTAPCKTFAGAISKTATNGVISTLDPGGFGAVTITKSITIDGSDQIAGVLAAATTGVIINATATSVVKLRNLEITGVLSGIDGVRILSAAEVTIENCRIHSFTNDGIKVANSSGVLKVAIRGADISNNLRGVEVLPTGGGTAQVSISDSAISTNTASGVDVGGASNSAAVFGSAITHNGTGVQVQQTTSTAFVEKSLIAYNGTGINSGVGGTPVIRLGHSAVVGNTTNGIAGAGTVVGFSSNMIVGNAGSNSVSSSSPSQ
jgi:hypothetical protein